MCIHNRDYISKKYISCVITRKSSICKCVTRDGLKYTEVYPWPYNGSEDYVIQIKGDFPASIRLYCKCCAEYFDVYPYSPSLL